MASITPFLMFKGDANQAVELYLEAFPDSEVVSLDRYSEKGPGAKGSVKRAVLKIVDREFTLIDSAVDHDFDFSASISFFVECDSLEMLENIFSVLAGGGEILMPAKDYGFSRQFAWVADRFGVSWQLNLK